MPISDSLYVEYGHTAYMGIPNKWSPCTKASIHHYKSGRRLTLRQVKIMKSLPHSKVSPLVAINVIGSHHTKYDKSKMSWFSLQIYHFYGTSKIQRKRNYKLILGRIKLATVKYKFMNFSLRKVRLSKIFLFRFSSSKNPVVTQREYSQQ